jgi:hypothetical protein
MFPVELFSFYEIMFLLDELVYFELYFFLPYTFSKIIGCIILKKRRMTRPKKLK